MIHDPEFEVKCKYDVTLITLNIASIYIQRKEIWSLPWNATLTESADSKRWREIETLTA